MRLRAWSFMTACSRISGAEVSVRGGHTCVDGYDEDGNKSTVEVVVMIIIKCVYDDGTAVNKEVFGTPDREPDLTANLRK